MYETLLAMDLPTLVSIVVKALAYLASLGAAGSALFLVLFADLDAGTKRAVRRLGLAAVGLAALFAPAMIPMGAIFLSGGSWSGALDPLLTRMVAQSPVGVSLAILVVGLVLLSVFLFGRTRAKPVAALGATVVCASFAFRGHVLAEPRLLLGALLTVHLLGLAFWIGAFGPLYRLARHGGATSAGAAAEAFGRKAVWVVGTLAIAGAGLLVLLTGNPLEALARPYGRFFAVKLALFVLLLGAAAFNRMRLTPALLAGDLRAARHLRRSIGLEVATVCAIALTTATLTTLSSPESAL